MQCTGTNCITTSILDPVP
ncbi:hypothetical protein GQ600_26515 [Phytophthora cactorum]|nr:hypothetical protein GQ600_26515 [Phytophthora cactorum]